MLFNRALHWLGIVENLWSYEAIVASSYEPIVTFDMREKRFNEILLPKEASVNRRRFMSVGVLEGCLCTC